MLTRAVSGRALHDWIACLRDTIERIETIHQGPVFCEHWAFFLAM
jgi:hypothetical protein